MWHLSVSAHEEVDDTLFRQLEEASCLQAWVFVTVVTTTPVSAGGTIQ